MDDTEECGAALSKEPHVKGRLNISAPKNVFMKETINKTMLMDRNVTEKVMVPGKTSNANGQKITSVRQLRNCA